MKLDYGNADKLFNIRGTKPERTSEFCTWNLSDLGSLMAQNPKDWRPLVMEALYYQFFTTFNEDQCPQAKAFFQKAVLVAGRSPIPDYILGELYTKSAFWTKKAWASDAARNDINRSSIPFFNKAIHLDPAFKPAYAARAEAYLGLKQDALAIKDFDEVLLLDPDDEAAHSDRGIARASLGQYYPAISDFDDAINAKEKSEDIYLPTSYENRGDAYIQVGDHRRAIGDYTNAIGLRVKLQVALWSLAQFRGLYPEYANIPDNELIERLRLRFAPQYEAAPFQKLLKQDNGKWEITPLLNYLYEKRGEAYLNIGNYRQGVADFQRIYVGMPNYAASIERWRGLGKFGPGDKYFLDVKASELSLDEPRL